MATVLLATASRGSACELEALSVSSYILYSNLIYTGHIAFSTVCKTNVTKEVKSYPMYYMIGLPAEPLMLAFSLAQEATPHLSTPNMGLTGPISPSVSIQTHAA